MITTTLQHASQIVEIQGAPPAAAKVSEGEFRASFVAANGGASTAERPAEGAGDFVRRVAGIGLPSSKVPSIAGTISKSPILATDRLLQAPTSPKADLTTEGPDKTTTDAATDGLFKSGRIPLADGLESTDVDAKTLGATAGSSSQPVAQIVDAAAENTLGAAAETTETIATATTDAAKKSVFDSVTASREPGVSASEKKRATAAERLDISGTGSVVPDPTAAVQVARVETATALPTLASLELAGTSLAERGSKTGILTSVAAASDTTQSQSVSSAGAARIGEVVSDGARLSQSGRLQRAATQEPNSTFDVAGALPVEVASEAEAAGVALAGNVSAARSLPKSEESIAATILEGQTSAATLTASLPLVGVNDGSSEPRHQTVQAKSDNTAIDTGARTVLSTGVRTVTAEIINTNAQLHPVAIAQTLLNSQSVAASSDVSALELPVKAADQDAVKSPQPASFADLLPGGQGLSIAVQSKPPQPSTGLRDVVVANASAAESSSSTAAVTAKSEKTKAFDAGAEQSTATSTSASLGVSDARTNSSLNSSVPQVGGADRVHAGAELLAPPVQGSLPPGTSSVRTGDSGTAIAGTAASLGAAGSNTAESGASAVPIAHSHQTLLATPTSLEVGVQSGTQGWLRIRAEVGDQGGVNATLAAGSSGGRELLHSQMPALNAFLHSEQMAVTTTVTDRGSLVTGGSHSAASLGAGSAGGQDGFTNSNSSLLQGGGPQGQESQRDSTKQALSFSEVDTATSHDVRNGTSAAAGPVSIGRSSEESGQWLNVRV